MTVRSGEAEGAHPTQRALDLRRHGVQDVGHIEPRVDEVDVSVGSLEMDRRGDRPVTKHRDDLDEGREAGKVVQVSQGRLHRADRAETPTRGMPSQRGTHRAHLDRVPQCGSRAVGFQVDQVLHIDPGCLPATREQFLLGTGVGSGDSDRAPVLVDGARADHRQDAIPVGESVVQSLEDHGRRTLTRADSIGRGVERPGLVVG